MPVYPSPPNFSKTPRCSTVRDSLLLKWVGIFHKNLEKTYHAKIVFEEETAAFYFLELFSTSIYHYASLLRNSICSYFLPRQEKGEMVFWRNVYLFRIFERIRFSSGSKSLIASKNHRFFIDAKEYSSFSRPPSRALRLCSRFSRLRLIASALKAMRTRPSPRSTLPDVPRPLTCPLSSISLDRLRLGNGSCILIDEENEIFVDQS